MSADKARTDYRTRLWKAEYFQRPDRIPFTFGVYGGLVIRYGQQLADLMSQYDFDGGPVNIKVDEEARELNPDYVAEDTDEWGVGWRHIKEGHLGQPISHPLADWSALKTFKTPPGPPPTSGEAFEKEKAHIAEHKRNHMTGGGAPTMGGSCFFERLQWLRGYENLMFDLAELPSQIYELADMIVEYNRAWTAYFTALGVDAVYFADDWGTQERLMIAPKRWREFFKPRYARMFEPAVQAAIHVHMHSDGYILDILEDWMEVGVNSFRPQFSCHRLEDFSKITWGRAAVHADVDRQYLMPFGTPEQIRTHIKHIIDVFGHPDGGLTGPGEALPDVPIENVKAALDAWVYYGGEYWNERREKGLIEPPK
jgi:uroporphyrinogen decarboxylase